MKRKKGGVLSTLTSILWVLFVIGGLLALASKLGVANADDFIDMIKAQALHYAQCIPAKECGLVPIIEDINPSDLIINQNVNTDNKENTGSQNSSNQGNTNGKQNINNNQNTQGKNILPENAFLSRDTRGYRGPIKNEAYVNQGGLVKKQNAIEMLNQIEVVDTADKTEPQDILDFNEKEWRYWISDENRPCWNTREQVLSRDVKPETAIYLDKHLERSEMKDACTMGKLKVENDKRIVDTEGVGEWKCPYTGQAITSPSELIIDHVVSLEYANQNGGNQWSPEEKEMFANDLDNLLAVSKKGYKEKQSKGFSKYTPGAPYRCQYAKNVTSILYKYNLTIKESDKANIQKALRMCQY